LGVIELPGDAVTQQIVDFVVGGDERHGLAAIQKSFEGIFDGWSRDRGV
jgi:hypothetical protein